MVPRGCELAEHRHLRRTCIFGAAATLSATVSRSLPDLSEMLEEEIERQQPRDLAAFFDSIETAKLTILQRNRGGIL